MFIDWTAPRTKEEKMVIVFLQQNRDQKVEIQWNDTATPYFKTHP